MKRLASLTLMALFFAAPPALGGHGVTQHVSTGPADSSGPNDTFTGLMSEDGSRAVFETGAQLVPEDQDAWFDIYEFSSTGVRLISTGSSDGPFVDLKTISADGTHVLFIAAHPLVAEDTDSREDLYDHHGNVTSLVSTGDAGGNADQSFCTDCPIATTPDGSHVFFYSPEQLVSEDTDSDKVDLYDRTGGVTRLVSTGPADGPSQGNVCDYTGWCGVRVSDDGETVAFQSFVDHVQPDSGIYPGLYIRSNGTTTTRIPASSNYATYLSGVSRDGSRVWFETSETLVPGQEFNRCEDVNESPVPCHDVFEYSSGTVKLISDSTGYAYRAGSTPDGTHVFFRVGCPFAWFHEECTYSVRMRHAGAVSVIADNAELVGFSDDGARVIVQTPLALVPQDTDGGCEHDWGPEGCYDVYEKSGGVFSLISTGPTGSAATQDSSGLAVSPDGGRVVFVTRERMVAEDTDSSYDVYTRAGTVTTLLSHGPAGGNGPYDAGVGHVSEDAAHVLFDTRERLSGTDLDDAWDVYLAGPAQSGGFPRPKGATPIHASLVPAYNPCTSPNREHGPPLSFGSCNPPVPASPNLTVGGNGGGGPPAKSTGYFRIDAIAGSPGPPDTADAVVTVSLSNVMNVAGLTDYTGTLSATASMRMTDRDSGAPSTIQDFPLAVTVPCAATADTTLGSACDVQTSFDSVVPGLAAEGMRSNLGLGQVRILDGNGSLFAVQGVFVP